MTGCHTPWLRFGSWVPKTSWLLSGPASTSELINLQNDRGQAKPYQLRQLLRLVERYHLDLGDEP